MRFNRSQFVIVPLAFGLSGLTASASSPPPTPLSYSQTVLSDAPVAYYRMDDLDTTLFDFSGNANQGSYINNPKHSAKGLIYNDTDTAVNFLGPGYAMAPNKTYLNFADKGFTLETWIQSPASPDGQIINKAKFGDSPGYMLSVNNGTLYFGGTKQLQTNVRWKSNQIYHIVAEADGGGKGAVYINGALANSGVVSDTWDYAGPLVIGANANGGQNFNGTIDEVAIYNKPLSALQIQKHYAAGSVPAPSALLVALCGAVPGVVLLSRRRRKSV